MSENIYVAMIHHRHGTNVYAARTEGGMLAQVAAYCRDEWDGEAVGGDPPEDDDACIERYFENVMDESWVGDQTPLKD